MMNFGTHKLQFKTWFNNLYKMLTYLALPIILGGGGAPGAYTSLYWENKFTLKDFQKDDEFWYT